jgi:hypothetical protein
VAVALGACLDFGGESGNEDNDGGEAGDSGASGAFGKGGSVAKGGAGPKGGTSAGGTGGASTTGGKGGTIATGGVSTGGVETGGVSTGGITTGGMSTGGVTTGGTSTGGKGGTSTGGTTTGGTSTGGVGGGTTGGTSTGGMAGKGGAAGAGGSGTMTCTTEELLYNGDFEAGDNEWVWDSYNWSSLIVTGTSISVAPQGGTYLARLGGYDYAEDVMNLATSIPTGATNIQLSFYEQIASASDYPYTGMAVGLLRDSDGSILGAMNFDDLDAHSGWVRHQLDIPSSAAGQAVIVGIETVSSDVAATFRVDTVSLTARVCR